MTLILAQLSDIHLKSSVDPVGSRTSAIAAAVSSAVLEPALCVLVFSGDLTFSGTDLQYRSFSNFATAIRQELLQRHPAMRVEWVMVPGNHDCDFSSALEIRDIVRSSLPDRLHTLAESGDVVDLMTIVQDSFFQYAARSGAWSDGWGRLYWENEFTEGSASVRFHCYNTAWISTLKELPGSLLYPVSVAEQHHAQDRPVSLAISVLHHPLRWLRPDNSQAFRQHLERTADMIITGHEHVDRSYTVADDDGATVRHLEGDVLQDHDRTDSGFQVLLIDLETRRVSRLRFSWKGTRYERSSPQQHLTGFNLNPALRSRGFTHSAQFTSYLNDCGVPLTHPRKDHLLLSDIFVYPDLRLRSSNEVVVKRKQRRARVAGHDFMQKVLTLDYALISGSANSGKSCLAKRMVSDLRTAGLVPLLLDGSNLRDVKTEAILDSLAQSFVEQYAPDQLEGYRQLAKSRRVIVIDNFHSTVLNRAGQRKLMDTLCAHSGLVVSLVDDLYLLEHLSNGHSVDAEAGRSTSIYEISDFGWRLRGELISKWHRLGGEYLDDTDDITHLVEQSEKLVGTVLGKHLLPSTPFTVLTILQTREPASTLSSAGGSFGYLYEHLITSAFAKISNRLIDIDTRYSYVSHIAYAMFCEGVATLSTARLTAVTEAYAAKIRIEFSPARAIDDLAQVRILERRGDLLAFKYRYIYCYFVARYIRDNKFTDASAGATLSYLTDRLHVEEYANILAFYVYLTRDIQVIDSLVDMGRTIFSEYPACDLETGYVSRLLTTVEPLVLPEPDNAEARRVERRQERDEAEEASDGEPEDASANAIEEARHVAYSADLSDILKINFAFKTLQILGQVLRNFPGSLPGTQKAAIATECYALGLRTLSAFLTIAEKGFDEFRQHVAKLIKEEHPMASRAEIAVSADEVIVWLTLGCAYGILKKVGAAVGLEDLKYTYDDVLRELGTGVPVRMIDVGIKLEHFRHPPVEELEKLSADIKDKMFANALLREMVGNYLYMYRIEDVRTRQKLGAIFNIASTSVRFMTNADKRG